MGDAEFYYCLDHHAVEPYEGCKSADRLGPYPSREAALQALDTVQARNARWEAEEEAERTPEERAEEEDRRKFGGLFGF